MFKVLLASGYLLFAALFTMPGCGKTELPRDNAPASGPPHASIHHSLVGKPAPDIVGQDLDGNPMRLSDYQGKAILIGVWASWCGPCRIVHPFEAALVKQNKGRPFVMLGVDGDDNANVGKTFAQAHGMDWPMFHDPNANILRSFKSDGYPTLVLIDGKGIVRMVHVGAEHLSQLKGLIETVIREAETN